MIYTTKIKTDLRSHEVLPGNYSENLFVCIQQNLDRYTKRTLPWHSHDSFEIDLILQGEMVFRTPNSSIALKEGDILFINSGIMHEYKGKKGCTLDAILFDSHFLSGIFSNRLERNYLLPLRESGLEFCAFFPDLPSYKAIRSTIDRSLSLLNEEPFGYELSLRSELTSFWLRLLKETASIGSKSSRQINAAEDERIKKMVEFIDRNYSEKISTASIAAAAGVSERECCRCFGKNLNITPIQYLTEYRIHVAAEMLLETDRSILEISEACGFSSPSYFSKVFSESLNCTPNQYRKNEGEVSG